MDRIFRIVDLQTEYMNQPLGMDVSLSTRNPAWCTPLFTLPLAEQTSFCIILASSTLLAMFLS